MHTHGSGMNPQRQARPAAWSPPPGVGALPTLALPPGVGALPALRLPLALAALALLCASCVRAPVEPAPPAPVEEAMERVEMPAAGAWPESEPPAAADGLPPVQDGLPPVRDGRAGRGAEEALPRGSDNPAVIALLDETEFRAGQGDAGAAVGVLERALRLEPKNPWLWHRLALLRFQQERWRLAVALAEKSNSLAAGLPRLLRANLELIRLAGGS